MISLKKYFYLLLIPVLISFTACKEDSKDNPTTPGPTVNESQVLAEYLVSQGDFMNTVAPAMATVDEVYTNLQTKKDKIYIIDVRSAADFTGKGHIDGAVNVSIPNLVSHIKTVNTANYEKIYVVCYTGQTGGYATAILRLLGYSNVFNVKWGMCAWNSEVATTWSTSTTNSYTNFVTEATAKNAAGSLPVLSTGKTTGKEILEARINALLSSADPFGDAKITISTIKDTLSKYYVVNYWSATDYNKGHIPGAVQYSPKADLKLDVALKTLPTDKPIVVYCYTGQTSAQVATVLKVLGYNAKSLMFGVSGFNYNFSEAQNLTRWVATECKNYPYVK